jgi:hypothetical protein
MVIGIVLPGIANLANDSLYHVAYRVVAGVDGEIGGFSVEWFALLQDSAENVTRVFLAMQQWAVVILAGALDQRIETAVQVYHRAALGKVRAVFSTEYGASARGQHKVGFLRELINDSLFPFTETGFTFFFEYQRDISTRALFDDTITVNKFHSQLTRELTTDGGFTGTHGSNQENTGIVVIHKKSGLQTGRLV